MIGLATGHRVINYGTKLQAYAMQEIMKSRGYKYEILQFNNTGDNLFKNFFSSIIHKLFDKYLIKRSNRNFLIKKYNNVSLELLQKIMLRSDAINSFDSLLKIKRFYGSRCQLTKYSYKYSAVFCGSDQAWLPSNVMYDFYTLNFVPKGVKRLSYAPSFGVNEIPYELEEKYKSFLIKLDGISVREESGAKIVESLTHLKVPVVLDPTLMLDSSTWTNLLDTKLSSKYGKYLLCYLLGDSKEHRAYSARVAHELGLELLYFPHFIKYKECDNIKDAIPLYNVTPQQFLALIKNSQFVITDSFHCTAFALQFHVPFSTLQRFKSNFNGSTNSRIYSLLKTFRCESRLVDISKENINFDYSFEQFESIIEKERKKSNSYLDTILVDIK